LKKVKRIFFVISLTVIVFHIVITGENLEVRSDQESISKPMGRFGHTMAYDSINQKVIMFGGAGLDLNNLYNDTWIFNSSENTWTNIDALIKEKTTPYLVIRLYLF
jgi:hypothetical protein